ncbi:MAG TPA: hypothetical protein VL404_05840 [Candidatus Eisenbacteria bacterium]|nr:hypothetical protein [Candidatus Eisenbacteria bacterium]
MSSINDALKKAAQTNEQIVRVPRTGRDRTIATFAILFLIFGCLAAAGVTIAIERSDRQRADADLSAKMVTLSQKYDRIMEFLDKSDSNLDIRVQLDMMDLRSEYKALVARFDSMSLEDKMSLKAEAVTLRKEMKSELQLLAKRLHNVERDHSVLADRIEEIKEPKAESAENPVPAAS